MNDKDKIYFLFMYRLQELSACNEENPDYSDIELIQHINVDVVRLTKLLSGKLYLFFCCFFKKNIFFCLPR